MRIALFSDVHANLNALNAVLADIETRQVDRILCLGDMVGYGSRPVEVLARLNEVGAEMIMGNHDAAACGKLDYHEDFNPLAAAFMDWTRDTIRADDQKFLSALPYVIEGERWSVAHCDMVDPEAFLYLDSECEARASWLGGTFQVLFVGHTHEAMIHRLNLEDNTYLAAAPQGFVCASSCRYIVNVGSVGFSRDDDYRAPYVLFDETAGLVTWLRVPYDLDAFANDIETRIPMPHPQMYGLLETRLNMGEIAMTTEIMLPSSETMAKLATRRKRARAKAAAGRRPWLWFGLPLMLLAVVLLGLVWATR